MDSKLKRTTIIVCISLVCLVLFSVLGINNVKSKKRNVVVKNTEEQANIDSEGIPAPIGDGNISQTGDLKAFLRDETFFDKDPIVGVLTDSFNDKRISLAVTSISRDLRIQIVDSNGELVTGEGFYITIAEVGEFKDLDQDGIIYIGDLSPNDYYITINELEGYRVPLAAMKVKVKDKVEYATIGDINLLIKSEDEVDLESDDVTAHNVIKDTDQTENLNQIPASEGSRLGIDVSSWNKEINWKLVKASGVDFAIIRCGFRGYTSGSLVEDAYFIKNIMGANEAGVKVGLYFFTQAINEVEAVEEASMVITLCRDYNVEFPVYIDTEGTGGNGRADQLDKATRTLVCKAFCETMENAGYRTGVYASKNWFHNNLDVSQLVKYYTWLAEYKAEATYEGSYEIWQYSSNGWISGITGRVDMNISYLGY
ncbi:MAG TPA: glycoside hydrolase family 25 protein [Lachnospiraceae bacterium]|nr:glycoside hydrolase family 25 protein [Lachnospiraceae bacterium]